MKRRSILVIDDEKIILESLKMFLTEKGYEVETAASVAEGRRKFETCSPDAAIMDIRLPDGDGLDLLGGAEKQREQGPGHYDYRLSRHGRDHEGHKAGRNGIYHETDRRRRARKGRFAGHEAQRRKKRGSPASGRRRGLPEREDRRKQQGDEGGLQGDRRPFREPGDRLDRRGDGYGQRT